MKALLVMLFACAFVAPSYGCKMGKSASAVQTKKIGGCVVETISIGTGKNVSADVPTEAAWIRVSSVEFAEYELYKKATLDLVKALEMRGVEIYSRSELMHIAEGACWPPYSVELKVNLNEQTDRPLYRFLLSMPIADHRPGTERPDSYGPFFITCGFGSSDSWTVWYQK